MKQVLLVDEDKEVKEKIKEDLNNAFPGELRISECSDGLEAIRRIEKQKFHCVITDIKLPKCDGNSLIRMIAALPTEYKPINILILSSYTAEPTSVKNSVISYLSKPLDDAALIKYFKEHVFGLNDKHHYKLDVNFINPFIDSTMEVLKVMADVDIEKEAVILREPDAVSGDISAIVSMVCSKFVGSFAITFNKDCFLDIASKMLYEDFTEINDENRDAAGEICNQVFGKTKTKMNEEQGLDIAKAIPAVIAGDGHTVKHQVPGKCLSVRFKTQKGTFSIEAVLKPV